MSSNLLIRGGRPNGGAVADILIQSGKITQIGDTVVAPADTVIESVDGMLVFPGLVEAHTHLDKTLWGMQWHENTVGPSLQDKIDHERLARKSWGIDPALQSARQVELSVSQGTTHILSHVDIDTENGLSCLEGVLQTKEKYQGIVDIQLAAFPQSGLMLRPGTAQLMDAAMALGCDWVGGLDPYSIDRDPKGHLDTIFGLAQKYARPIDIHLHEPEEMGAQTLSLIFERTKALGMASKVTISHAFCLGSERGHIVNPLIDQILELDIAIVTTGPIGWSSPPIKRLIDAGVRVGGGSDGVRDTWKHYGNADMLERAMFIGMRNRFTRDDEMSAALDICTHGGAAVMNIEQGSYGLEVGCDADLFVIEADNVSLAVAMHPPRKLVVKRGQVVGRDGYFVPLN